MTNDPANVRPLVAEFAAEMERRLVRHENEPPWTQDGRIHFIELCTCIGRLAQLLKQYATRGPPRPEALRSVAADIANYAMICVDLVGSWRTAHDGRGRRPECVAGARAREFPE